MFNKNNEILVCNYVKHVIKLFLLKIGSKKLIQL